MEKMNKRTLCKTCLEDFKATTMGGLVGTAIAILTGFIAAIPISMFGGLLVDSTPCENCGSEDDLHEITTVERDEPGWFFRQTDAEPETDGFEGPEFEVEHDVSFDFDMDMDGFGGGE